jgi:curved DNA-binding protein CbpA
MSMQARGPNHYQLLGVTRESNPLEIKRSYRKLSVTLHPDKNPSPTATEEFDAVKKGYDILMDMEFREVYNKFGQEGIDSNKRFDESQFFMELGIFYLTWGMLAYVLTLGKKSGDARQWTFTGLIIMLVVEIYIMTSQTNPLPSELFPTWTEHECVWLLHTLFPAFMNGCRSLGSYLYVDLDQQARNLLLALKSQNEDVLLVLRDVQIGIQSIQANGGGGGGSRIAAAVGTSGIAPSIGATPTGKIRELQQRLQASDAQVTRAVKDLQVDGKKNSSLGFYAMIFGYIAMSYFFNK